MKIGQIDGVVMFVRAGTAGSFAAAARTAGVTPSAVSKAVSRLEVRLGIRLFDRTTHAIRMTEAGRLYFEQCRSALEAIEGAELTLLGHTREPRGRLRVSSSVPFARAVLAPLLPAFVAQYPSVQIELVSTDRMSDLVEDEFDILIRTGHLSDTGLIARKLIDTRMVAAASPSYFSKHEPPATVEELRKHELLTFVFPHTRRVFDWFFEEGKSSSVVRPGTALCFTEAGAMIAAAEAGAGIVFLQDYILAEALVGGRLTECLRQCSIDGGPVSALWLPAKQLMPALRCFVDFLAASCNTYVKGAVRINAISV